MSNISNVKFFKTTQVGRSARHGQKGGNPLMMALAGAVLPAVIGPMIGPLMKRITGGKKKRTYRRY